LHQYFTYIVGTLSKSHDRNVVSNTFTIDNGKLKKTPEFAPGEWLLTRCIETGVENVPIFINSENSEKNIEKFLNF